VIRDSTPLLSEEGWRTVPGWWKRHRVTASLDTRHSTLDTKSIAYCVRIVSAIAIAYTRR